jgi:hypothetical protein
LLGDYCDQFPNIPPALKELLQKVNDPSVSAAKFKEMIAEYQEDYPNTGKNLSSGKKKGGPSGPGGAGSGENAGKEHKKGGVPQDQPVDQENPEEEEIDEDQSPGGEDVEQEEPENPQEEDMGEKETEELTKIASSLSQKSEEDLERFITTNVIGQAAQKDLKQAVVAYKRNNSLEALSECFKKYRGLEDLLLKLF